MLLMSDTGKFQEAWQCFEILVSGAECGMNQRARLECRGSTLDDIETDKGNENTVLNCESSGKNLKYMVSRDT